MDSEISASAELVARDAKVFFHQHGSSPCLAGLKSVSGSWIEDLDGRRYLDLHGNTTHHIGHANPELIAALKAQLDVLTFSPRRYANEPATALAELLTAQWPGGAAKVLFTTGGSDAIEVAIKLARVATGRRATAASAGCRAPSPMRGSAVSWRTGCMCGPTGSTARRRCCTISSGRWSARPAASRR